MSFGALQPIAQSIYLFKRKFHNLSKFGKSDWEF